MRKYGRLIDYITMQWIAEAMLKVVKLEYSIHNWLCLNVSTTPIMAMGCRQCLPLSVVQLRGKYCRKPHCRNGVVDTFGLYNRWIAHTFFVYNIACQEDKMTNGDAFKFTSIILLTACISINYIGKSKKKAPIQFSFYL